MSAEADPKYVLTGMVRGTKYEIGTNRLKPVEPRSLDEATLGWINHLNTRVSPHGRSKFRVVAQLALEALEGEDDGPYRRSIGGYKPGLRGGLAVDLALDTIYRIGGANRFGPDTTEEGGVALGRLTLTTPGEGLTIVEEVLRDGEQAGSLSHWIEFGTPQSPIVPIPG